jgi:hypothetical protein
MTTEAVAPAEWRIVRSFTHRGIVCSAGVPVPETLTAEEAEVLYRQRVLARRDPGTGGFVMAERPQPVSAAEYVQASDLMLLRRIRAYQPDRAVVEHILREIEANGRGTHSPVLLEALRLAVGVPVGPEDTLL